MTGRKRRNADKRREKSRCAARHRREKEAGIFTDLYVTVPIVSEPTITHVDRIAVLRLAATLCRARKVSEKVFTQHPGALDAVAGDFWKTRDIYAEASINECLDGFLMLIDSSGLIVYISPSCSRSLGLTQTDLIGHSLHDYLHMDDSVELPRLLDESTTNHSRLFIRMKSVLSPRGRNLNLKSALCKTVNFMVSKSVVEFPPIQPRRPASRGGSSDGIEVQSGGSDLDDDDEDSLNSVTQLDSTYYLMHGLPIAHYGAGTSSEHHGPGTFMTRHTMDMRFSYCQERLSDHLGYDIKALMGSSFYALVHPQDLPELVASMKHLYRKGQVCTGYYRLMVKSGGCVWIMSEANTITHSTRGHRGQYIVCMHQIICVPENREIMGDVQRTAPSLLCKIENERKLKQAKVVGPTMEQLLQRAPTVHEMVPLFNPATLLATPVSSRGGGEANAQQQNWLFRQSGGVKSNDIKQRRNVSKRPDAAVGPANIVSRRGHRGRRPAAATAAAVFVPAAGSFDTAARVSENPVLYAPVLATSFRPAVNNVQVNEAVTTDVGRRDNFSMLAPFVASDECLSLNWKPVDFRSDASSLFTGEIPKIPLEFEDNFDIPMDIFTNEENKAACLVNPVAASVQYYQQTTGQQQGTRTTENDSDNEASRIESIYRYLRNGGTDFETGEDNNFNGMPGLLSENEISVTEAAPFSPSDFNFDEYESFNEQKSQWQNVQNFDATQSCGPVYQQQQQPQKQRCTY